MINFFQLYIPTLKKFFMEFLGRTKIIPDRSIVNQSEMNSLGKDKLMGNCKLKLTYSNNNFIMIRFVYFLNHINAELKIMEKIM